MDNSQREKDKTAENTGNTENIHEAGVIEEHHEGDKTIGTPETPTEEAKAEAAAKAAEEPKVRTAEDEVKELKAKLEDMNDKYLRLYSEFDNFRRRTQKERIELNKTAGVEFFTSLLPVLDDFERALDNIKKAKDLDSVKEGVSLIYNKLNAGLVQKGLTPMETKGVDFDSEVHEAITSMDMGAEFRGKVVDELEKGYFLNGKVIRYSKVVVGK